MKLIYERSVCAVVWLGLDIQTEVACAFIRRVEAKKLVPTKEMSCARKLYLLPEVAWASQRLAIAPRYWTRSWVIQEFILPPALEIWCGTERISWTALYQVSLGLPVASRTLSEHGHAMKLLGKPSNAKRFGPIVFGVWWLKVLAQSK